MNPYREIPYLACVILAREYREYIAIFEYSPDVSWYREQLLLVNQVL